MIARVFEFYQRWISPALHSISGMSGACRFQPICSEYAACALERHGALRGTGLALWRLLRCNPFSRGGFDPVPGGNASPAEPRRRHLAGWMERAPRSQLTAPEVTEESTFRCLCGRSRRGHLP